jgi:hypothetical protein
MTPSEWKRKYVKVLKLVRQFNAVIVEIEKLDKQSHQNMLLIVHRISNMFPYTQGALQWTSYRCAQNTEDTA